jgi:hypothetical protein
MAKCEVCGNEYAQPLKIEHRGRVLVFDSFECAIHSLAPKCEHCGCMIIGHGVEADGKHYCCAHCARAQGEHRLRDSAGAQPQAH